jgi:hypothetical protein
MLSRHRTCTTTDTYGIRVPDVPGAVPVYLSNAKASKYATSLLHYIIPKDERAWEGMYGRNETRVATNERQPGQLNAHDVVLGTFLEGLYRS